MVAAAARTAFLKSSYGTSGERFQLTTLRHACHALPSWAEGGRCWAFVTAWNPGGRQTSAEVNARANDALRARTADLGVRVRPAVNGEGRWREAALLLEGARLVDAVTLGIEFGQLAVVFGVGRRASLVWCLDGMPSVERFWLTPLVAR